MDPDGYGSPCSLYGFAHGLGFIGLGSIGTCRMSTVFRTHEIGDLDFAKRMEYFM